MTYNNDYRITASKSCMAQGLTVLRGYPGAEGVRPRRVAAYCRVSTDLEVQESSLDTQMKSFRRLIDSRPDWELAGIYADKGLSGTSADRRTEFNRMINDAMEGRIDYILAKSISRFARNTVDTLNYTRFLKAKGVGVYFEEQNLDTECVTSEIFLTIHAAFAQEESHSLSENMKRGVRSRFAMGIPKWSRTYGLEKTDGDRWEIRREEADIIRRIFAMYIEGKGLSEIGTETARIDKCTVVEPKAVVNANSRIRKSFYFLIYHYHHTCLLWKMIAFL